MPRGVFTRTDEHRAKLRAAWHASEKCRAHLAGLSNINQTPEARAKRSASLKATLRHPDVRQRRAEAMSGRTVSQETREKIRVSLTRLTDDQRRANKRITRVFSNQLRRIMKKMSLRKGATAEQILGYTREQLRAHLESQFKPGMSWEAGGFHVDHIKPVAAFIREGVTNPAVIHALDNLQVLTPRENLTKSDKFPLLQVPA